jgi:hypothetical protein
MILNPEANVREVFLYPNLYHNTRVHKDYCNYCAKSVAVSNLSNSLICEGLRKQGERDFGRKRAKVLSQEPAKCHGRNPPRDTLQGP